MASIISAGTTSATALNMSADTTGILQLASNNGTVALTVTTTQNIGIGVIPSVWLWPNGSANALQLQGGAAFTGYNVDTYVSQNWYYNAGEKYIANGFASRYTQANGQHSWSNAGNNSSGAGASVSWSTPMTLTQTGRLGIGNTSPTNLLDVSGTIGKDYTSNVTVPNNNVATAVLNAFNTQNFSVWLLANFPSGAGRYNGTISISWDTGNCASSAIFAFTKHQGFDGVSIVPMAVTNYLGSTTVSGNIIYITNNGTASLTPVFKILVTSTG
jgi:hypothetical protein